MEIEILRCDVDGLIHNTEDSALWFSNSTKTLTDMVRQMTESRGYPNLGTNSEDDSRISFPEDF